MEQYQEIVGDYTLDEKEIVGNIYSSKNFGDFRIVSYEGKNKYYIRLYKIKFLNTGYECVKQLSSIKSGSVKDKYKPNVFGVGFVGDTNKVNKKIYRTWQDMLRRCYDKNSNNYSSCGGEGVRVDLRWHNYTRFASDITEVDGWNKEKFLKGDIELDKDKKQIRKPMGQRIYYKDTCSWLTSEENSLYSRKNIKMFKAVSPSGVVHYAESQKQFADNQDLTTDGINAVLNKENKITHKGWRFEWL